MNSSVAFSTTIHVQKILQSPDAPRQIQSMVQALEAEKQRRLAFYEWVTEDVKAEFINGEIVIQSPVRRRHWKVSSCLSDILSIYSRIKSLGSVGVEKVMIALTRNDYEPDICFFSKEKDDLFTEDQVLFPAPDFVVEILSKKTAKIDRTTKKADYAAHGVREYWIVDPVKQQVEQYFLLNENDTEYFEPNKFGIEDDIESRVVTGFNIPVRAIFDEKTNVETLQKLLN